MIAGADLPEMNSSNNLYYIHRIREDREDFLVHSLRLVSASVHHWVIYALTDNKKLRLVQVHGEIQGLSSLRNLFGYDVGYQA